MVVVVVVVVVVVAELSRAQRARSGAPWVRIFSYLPIREKLGYDVSVLRLVSRLFGGEGRESGVHRSGRGVCYISLREIVRCICATCVFFFAGNRASFQNLVYFRNLFLSI